MLPNATDRHKLLSVRKLQPRMSSIVATGRNAPVHRVGIVLGIVWSVERSRHLHSLAAIWISERVRMRENRAEQLQERYVGTCEVLPILS